MNEISNELKSHFLRLYQMAIIDEDFSSIELKMLYRFAEERGVSTNELDKILLTANNEFAIPEKVEDKLGALYDLAIMIWADGKVTEDEKNTLKKYCKKFEFIDENIDELTEYLLSSTKEGISKIEIINQIK